MDLEDDNVYEGKIEDEEALSARIDEVDPNFYEAYKLFKVVENDLKRLEDKSLLPGAREEIVASNINRRR